MRPEHVQGSDAWLEHRRNYLGASDAPIIMGASPWKTPFQLWEDKLGISPPQEETWAMKRGTDMEPLARASFEKETGLEVFPQIVYHPEHSFMMASMDGLSLDGKHAVEIKCPGAKAHQSALDGIVPDYYMPQLQHQLACIGLEMLWYYSFDGKYGALVEVHRDDTYIDKLIEKECKFWECVKSSTPPPLTNKDYSERNSDTWNTYGERVAVIDDAISKLKAEREEIRQFLISDSGGNSSRCGSLTLAKSYPIGRVDYKAIPELKTIDLNQYRKPSREQWTLKYSKSRG